jgi:hypothetical protein
VASGAIAGAGAGAARAAVIAAAGASVGARAEGEVLTATAAGSGTGPGAGEAEATVAGAAIEAEAVSRGAVVLPGDAPTLAAAWLSALVAASARPDPPPMKSDLALAAAAVVRCLTAMAEVMDGRGREALALAPPLCLFAATSFVGP